MSFPFGRDRGPYLGFTYDKHADAIHYGGPDCKNLSLMILGPNGSGKDTAIITPNLAQLRRSVFILDVKSQQCAITMRHRAKFSKIIVFNPYGMFNDTHPWMKSHGFNVLTRADFNPASPRFNSRAVDIAEFLIRVSGGDTFFTDSAKAVIAGACMWDRMQNGPNASLANVRNMLGEFYGTNGDGAPTGLLKTVIDMGTSAMRSLTNKINRLAVPTNEARSVISTVLAQTTFLDDPQIAEDVSKGGFDFADMKRECITVYCILPLEKLETDASWLRLIVGTCLRDLQRTLPGAGPPPLLILNEVAQLGFLEPLEKAMGIARGFGCQIMTVWQSLAQIKNIYKDNFETIVGARGVLGCYAPQDLVTAEYVSKLVGKTTELMGTINARPGQAQTDMHESPQGVPLLHPEDLMRLPNNTMLTWREPVPYPFKTRTPGYWNTKWAQGLDPDPYYVPRQREQFRPQASAPPTPPRMDYRKAIEDLRARKG
jgi:type IV secretion system protein VirD4